MERVETNKVNKEDELYNGAQKKKLNGRSYRLLFMKKRKKVYAENNSDDQDRSDNKRRKDGLLEEKFEKTLERIEVTSTSQCEKEAIDNDDKHNLVPTSLNDSCKGMPSNVDGPFISKGGLVDRELNSDADKAKQDLQNTELDRGKLDAGVGGGHVKKSGNDIQKHISSTDLLSRLDSQNNSNGNDSLGMNSSDDIGIVKERLAKHMSSRFVEYWIPVNLSNLQVEKYCFTLHTNKLPLCSPSKADPVGAVHNVLIASKKCCDHPYIVDQSLEPLLTAGLKKGECLDVGIKASAKLQLLDQMLLEIKKREHKVLILFQSIGGRDVMGAILDEYLHKRFGEDSYQWFDGGLAPSKKQSSLNRFNNEKKRFVFLMETQACVPSIKLSAVGTVIIFSSDWNPMNDLRALRKMTYDSQFEQIKLFRLYSSFTVEERALMLSKQDKTVDSYRQNINPSNCHMLLMWGASILLQQFHDISTSGTSNLSVKYHLKDVIKEFIIILDQIAVEYGSKLSHISLVKQDQGMYRTETPLFGEQQIKATNEDSPHVFWTKLLTGKSQQLMKYFSCSSQRNRKRIQYYDDVQNSKAENAEVVKRHKQVVNDCDDYSSQKAGLHEEKMAALDRECNLQGSSTCELPCSLDVSVSTDNDEISTSNSLQLPNISELPMLSIAEWESRRKQLDSQKNVHVLLKPQLAKLCEILRLPEEVKKLVQRFSEYVMNNHLGVYGDTAAMSQAFQISLCWSAASLLEHDIDQKESLALARQHLGFICEKTEAYDVNSKLQCLKGLFQYRTGKLSAPISPKASEEGSDLPAYSESGEAIEFKLAQSDLEKSINDVKLKLGEKVTKLLEKQREETKKLTQKYDEEKLQLENKIKLEAAIIRLHGDVPIMAGKLMKLEDEYRSKFYELEQQRDVEVDNLVASREPKRKYVLERMIGCPEAIKSWALTEFLKPPVSEVNLCDGRNPITGPQNTSSEAPSSEEVPGESTFSETDEVAIGANESVNICADSLGRVDEEGSLRNFSTEISGKGQENVVSLEEPSSVEVPDGSNLSKVDGQASLVEPIIPHSDEGGDSVFSAGPSFEDIPNGANLSLANEEVNAVSSSEAQENVICANASLEKQMTLEDPVSGNAYKVSARTSEIETPSHGMGILVSSAANLSLADEEVPLTTPDAVSSSETQENVIPANASPEKQMTFEATVSVHDDEVPTRTSEIETLSHGMDILVSNEANVSLAGEEVRLAIPIAVSSSEAQENVISANTSPEKQTFEATVSVHDDEVPTRKSEIKTPSHGMDILVSSYGEEIPDVTVVSMPAAEVSSAVPETLHSEDQVGVNIQRDNDVTIASKIELQDGVVCNMNQDSEFREPSLVDVSPVQSVATFDQDGSLPRDQVAETLSSAAANVRCNESNADSSIVDLREQMQLLKSTELAAVNQAPQAPRQAVSNHVELSNQDILQPLLTPTDGPVIHGSETRTASVPNFSGHPVETAPDVSSQVPLPPYADPLLREMERVQNEIVQSINSHHCTMKQLKEEYEKEIEEFRKKYELKVQEKEAAFLLHKKELDQNYNKVCLNKSLAEAFRSKHVDFRASGAAGARPETSFSFMERLVQLLPQQPSTAPALAYGQHSTVSPVNAKTMGPSPSLQVVNSAAFTPRPPRISSISPSAANHVIGEIRTSPTHLQPFRPPSISPTLSIPSQHAQAQSYHHLASPTLLPPLSSYHSHWQAQASTSCQSGWMIQPETAAVLAPLPNSSLPSDLLVGISGANTNPLINLFVGASSCMAPPPSVHEESNMPSVQPNPAQQSEPIDVVCLSDDD